MAGIKFIHTDDKEVVIKGTPNVPINKSKKLNSIDGSESLFYIETETAFKMKLDSKVDFSKKHPQDDNFSLITIPINRI
jgi:hypothetical protein